MALKPITRQEQIIAGKNLEPITRMERFLKEYGGGSGGGAQSDWNQTDSSAADFIKNKPFYDSPTGGDTLYWDGNTEGLANVDGIFFRVSDVVPTKENFLNGCSIDATDGSQLHQTNLTSEEVQSGFSEDGLYFGELFLVVPHDNYTDEYGTIEKKGTYLLISDGVMYVCSLTIPGYTGFPVTKKIEEKYLPGPVILYADAENYLYATSDTSDTSKRMTTAELLNAVESGKSIYVYDKSSDGMVSYNQSLAFVALGDAGGIETMSGEFFAAEYTG